MGYKYTFNPLAANEYEEIFKWYEERSAKAADNFIIAVQKAIQLICEKHFRYRNTFKKLREINISKYPYNIIYYPDEQNETIVVVSIYHHKRNPIAKYIRGKK